MTENLFSESGFWWPERARGQADRYLRHQRDTDPAIRLCSQRRTALQAGGHIGLFPLWLARKFERVLTFEPCNDNWECLLRNVAGNAKITPCKALLGESQGVGRLLLNGKNSGGHKCLFNGEREALPKPHFRLCESMPVFAIDDLGRSDVDLIQLDVEGAELPALKGAVKTIKASRPVIQLEIRGHGEIHGYTDAELCAWLAGIGYVEAHKVARDRVFLPRRDWR